MSAASYPSAMEYATDGTDVRVRAWANGALTLHAGVLDRTGEPVADVEALITTIRTAAEQAAAWRGAAS